MLDVDCMVMCFMCWQPVKDNKYSAYLELDLDSVEPCISGPKRCVTSVVFQGFGR